MDSCVAMGTRCGLPYPQNAFSFFPSFLTSFCPFRLITSFQSLLLYSIYNLSLLFPFTDHIPPCRPSLPLSLWVCACVYCCSQPTHLPISSFDFSLFFSLPSVPLVFLHPSIYPSILSHLWSLCLYNIHFYSILFLVVMAIGWGRERASVSKQAGVGVSEVTSLGR